MDLSLAFIRGTVAGSEVALIRRPAMRRCPRMKSVSAHSWRRSIEAHCWRVALADAWAFVQSSCEALAAGAGEPP